MPIYIDPGVEEIVAVPRAVLGKVVGKRGATIAEIRERSGAWKVDARDQSSDPCQVKLGGTPDAVRRAREIIVELVGSQNVKHAGAEYIEISQGRIGRVIGPKGAQVNEIEAQTNTKIDIDYEREPCRVYILGHENAVNLAKRVLLEVAK